MKRQIFFKAEHCINWVKRGKCTSVNEIDDILNIAESDLKHIKEENEGCATHAEGLLLEIGELRSEHSLIDSDYILKTINQYKQLRDETNN